MEKTRFPSRACVWHGNVVRQFRATENRKKTERKQKENRKIKKYEEIIY
jgi:hypothetical protein